MADASVVVKWVLDEPGSEEALELARQWAARDLRVLAPALLWFEVGNVPHRRVLAGQISPARAVAALEGLLEATWRPCPSAAS